jgi:hypothetical protein
MDGAEVKLSTTVSNRELHRPLQGLLFSEAYGKFTNASLSNDV